MNKEDELYLKYLLQNYEPVKASKDQLDLWMKKYKNKLKSFWNEFKQERDIVEKRNLLKSVIKEIIVSSDGGITLG